MGWETWKTPDLGSSIQSLFSDEIAGLLPGDVLLLRIHRLLHRFAAPIALVCTRSARLPPCVSSFCPLFIFMSGLPSLPQRLALKICRIIVAFQLQSGQYQLNIAACVCVSACVCVCVCVRARACVCVA